MKQLTLSSPPFGKAGSWQPGFFDSWRPSPHSLADRDGYIPSKILRHFGQTLCWPTTVSLA